MRMVLIFAFLLVAEPSVAVQRSSPGLDEPARQRAAQQNGVPPEIVQAKDLSDTDDAARVLKVDDLGDRTDDESILDHLKDLASLLDEDDITGARVFVDELLWAEKISAEEALQLHVRIEEARLEKFNNYTRRILDAVTASDTDAVAYYNARMRRLKSGSQPDAGRSKESQASVVDQRSVTSAENIEPSHGGEADTTRSLTMSSVEDTEVLSHADAGDRSGIESPTEEATLTGVMPSDLVFSAVEGASSPVDGFNLGKGAAPTLVDIDQDDDLDLFVGDADGNVSFLENTGTPASPAFAGAVESPFGLSDIGSRSKMTFGDWDRDGDLDAIKGVTDSFEVFENTGSKTSPSFKHLGNAVFGLSPTNGIALTPVLVDIDNDGDLDLFSGKDGAPIFYMENVGDAANPLFEEGVVDPFGLKFNGSNMAIEFVDLDGDGDLDTFQGGNDGRIFYQENIGSVSDPIFANPATSPFGLEVVGRDIKVAFGDLDGDGDSDMIYTDMAGAIGYVQNTSLSSQLAKLMEDAEPSAADAVAKVEVAPNRLASLQRQMRTAFDAGRLLNPDFNNAFDTALDILAQEPNDPDAKSIVAGVVSRQSEKIAVSLDENRIEEVIRLRQQLESSMANLGADTDWSRSFQSKTTTALGGISRQIVQVLQDSARSAIQKNYLTLAPEGSISALASIELLALEVGADDERVADVVLETLGSYARLIEARVASNELDRVATLLERMQQISSRFDAGVQLTSRTEDKIEVARSYNRLLSQARILQEKGRLIRPSVDNAIEVVKRAMTVRDDHEEAEALFEQIVFEAQVRIGNLIDNDRRPDAVGDLELLSAAVQDVNEGLASTYLAAAERLATEIAERERGGSVSGEVATSEGATPSVDEQPSAPPSFMFTNPF